MSKIELRRLLATSGMLKFESWYRVREKNETRI